MAVRKIKFLISSGPVKMIVDRKFGGRILSFKLNDYEFLTGKNIHPENFGSTLWSSPQSCWNWPPPPVLDSGPYSVIENESSILMTSAIDPVTGFQFVKEFSAGKNGWMNLTYSIVNTTGEFKKAAPWDISRVPKGGLFFFPIGERPMSKKQFEPARTNIMNGIAWYQDEKERPANHKLSISDGSEGWVAYAIDGKIFIKRFRDIKPEMQAPGEAEVLFYVSAEADYIEIEVQGRYETMKPSEKSVWSIEWTGVKIPSNIPIEKGTEELVEFVRRLIEYT